MLKVNAPPHDLGKVENFRLHNNPKHLRQVFEKLQETELFKIMTKHHDGGTFKALTTSDKISSSLSRVDISASYEKNDTIYFVPVYGDIKVWTKEHRLELLRKIRDLIDKKLIQIINKEPEAYEEINDLLYEFPQDTRCPFVSLKTHHMFTSLLESRIKENPELMTKEEMEIFLVKATISLEEAHRLREIREFYRTREDLLKAFEMSLSKYSPIKISDELYFLLTSEVDKNDVLSAIDKSPYAISAKAYIYRLGKCNPIDRRICGKDKCVAGLDRPYTFVVNHFINEYSLGKFKERLTLIRDRALWKDVLDGKFDWVAWILIKPAYNSIEKLVEEFVNRAKEDLASVTGIKVEKGVCPMPPLSPELHLAISLGYEKFIEECKRALLLTNPNKVRVVDSFDYSLFLYGLKDVRYTFLLYYKLNEISKRLRLNVLTSIVVSKPKHPFWNILEIFNYNSAIAIVKGDKLLELSNEDAEILRSLIPKIKQITKSQFNNIIEEVRKKRAEALKLYIQGLNASNKINNEASEALCCLVDRFSEKYKEDETGRRLITVEAFNMLKLFAGGEE